MLTNVADESIRDGGITKIMFHRFLTYDDVTIHPGGNLNFIAGSNGAGKSTILCGICLALGGNPKLLGRSEHWGDYVKHGFGVGSCEVLIKDSKRTSDVSFKIILHKENSVDYFIDGRKATQTAVRSRVISYNIQVDNPCTFLAQDKVQSFARQNPQLLLENTEKVSSDLLPSLHKGLIDLRTRGKYTSSTKEKLEFRLTEVEKELHSLKSRVETFEQRESMKKKLDLLRKKEVILKFKEIDDQLKEAKCQSVKENKRYKKSRKKISYLETLTSKYAKKVEEFDQKIHELMVTEHNVNKSFEEIVMCEPVNIQIESARKEYERRKKDVEKWTDDLLKAKLERDVIREKLAKSSDDLVTVEDEDKSLDEQVRQLRVKADKLDIVKYEIEKKFTDFRRRKEELEDAIRNNQEQFEEKLHVLRTKSDSKQYDAWNWYEQNRDKFQHNVYVPLLHMTMKGNDAAKFVESVLSPRDMFMFIFGCRDDERLLTGPHCPWRINSTFLSTDEVKKFSPSAILKDKLRHFGFNVLLSDLISAPPTVMAYLNSVANLDKIPVGTQKTEDNIERICETLKHELHVFLTPTSVINMKVSRFSGTVSLRTSSLCDRLRLLVVHTPSANQKTIDQIAYQSEARKLRDKVISAEKEQENWKNEEKRISEELEKYRIRRNEILKVKNAHKHLEQQLAIKERRINIINENKPDLEEPSDFLAKVESDIIEKAFERGKNLLQILSERSSLLRMSTFSSMRCNKAKKNLRKVNAETDEKKKEIEEIKETIQLMEKKLENVTQQRKIIQQQLEELVGVPTLDSSLLDSTQIAVLEKLTEVFIENAISDDLGELHQELVLQQGRLECALNEGSQNDYNRQCALIQEKLELVEKLTSQKNLVSELGHYKRVF
ncbi:hypothetical protein AB6A40_004400 [Gnathostoma spinigerum]|uniref:Structural maintenance of chromosomes protein 5 n=1 Tax=Gnathostoma spinigerum TaxID=75299 RepID=A0ABD6EDG6_9BILA